MGLQKRKIFHEAEYFPHYYLCNYIPKSAGSDRLSQSLLHFKNGVSPHQVAWIECAVEELKNVQELRDAFVIRALSHDELVRSYEGHEAIRMLTVQIGNAVRGTNVDSFLEKVRHVKKLSMLNKAERENELYRVYKFTPPARDPKHILIIDDILTSGATVKSIISAILASTPSARVSVFTLAHTSNNAADNHDVSLKGKTYYWQPNDSWMVCAEDAPEYAATLARLKHAIMNDLFF